MNKEKSISFKNIYITFLTLIISVFLVYCGFILIKIDAGVEKFILGAFIFTSIIISIGVIFVLIIRKKVRSIVDLLDNMIDSAINEESMITGYEETILSSLENKMLKYIRITKNNKEAIENERNKVKTLVSDISHQTKTPIANILLYSQLALENEDVDEDIKEILGDVKNQSERLNFLIQALIKMSRLESGIIEPSKNKVKLKYTIEKSVQEIYINAQSKNIDIDVKCDESTTAFIDEKWTVEAAVNILENAIKYTNTNGKIEISTTSYEMFKRIDIKDNGIGIEEEELNNIFKRFYRCKNAKQYEGVGIGLYLTREIISLQGGYIKVYSDIGKGSTFSIFLPS